MVLLEFWTLNSTTRTGCSKRHEIKITRVLHFFGTWVLKNMVTSHTIHFCCYMSNTCVPCFMSLQNGRYQVQMVLVWWVMIGVFRRSKVSWHLWGTVQHCFPVSKQRVLDPMTLEYFRECTILMKFSAWTWNLKENDPCFDWTVPSFCRTQPPKIPQK